MNSAVVIGSVYAQSVQGSPPVARTLLQSLQGCCGTSDYREQLPGSH